MADPRKALEAEKAQHLAQAAEIERKLAQIAQIEAQAADLGFKLVAADSAVDVAFNATGSGGGGVYVMQVKTGGRRDPNSATARAKVEAAGVIRKIGQPVPLSRLNEELAKIGIKFGGKNPSWQLSAVLCRDPQYISTDRGWWLNGMVVPPRPKIDMMDLVQKIAARSGH